MRGKHHKLYKIHKKIAVFFTGMKMHKINYHYWQLALFLILLGTYSLLLYLILTNQYRVDFSSFYSAAQTLHAGENPYRVLSTTYLPTVKKLSANLNPPMMLWLFSPLSQLNYHMALAVWSIFSFILGLIGAGIAFKHAFPPHFLKKNWFNLYLLYLAFFATISNTAIAQLGAILLFFIMIGYHFYTKNHNYLAGIMWGIIIAIKLFPALLFFYVLSQKRYKTLVIMFSTLILMWLIPLLIYGPTIYNQYFSMMTRVLWYGDSWNASVYGFIFRLFVDTHNKTASLLLVKTLYGILFFLSLLWYLREINIKRANRVHQQSFCLTLVMMLIMSPFGWLYYFSILIPPLALTWLAAVDERTFSNKILLMWLLCLFLLNFPMDYVSAGNMTVFLDKLGFYSFYFYGLLLLAYLLTRSIEIDDNNEIKINATYHYFLPATLIIFAFGLLVPIISFIMRLFGTL